MNKRNKNSILKMLQKEGEKLAETRDNLRELQDELNMQLKDSEEAIELLEECIYKLSELN